MSEIVIFHPAGIGDFLMDLSNLYQLIKSDLAPRRFKYVCNVTNKPLVKYSEIDKILDIKYLKYPSYSISDLMPLIKIGQKAKKVFVLSGMNLKKVSYLKHLWPEKVNYFGTLENYPLECLNKMTPNEKDYQYVQGPTKHTHRIIENFNLFKSQKLLNNDDFLLKGLNSWDIRTSSSNQSSYIVVHTGQSEIGKKKSMDIGYWVKLLSGIKNRIGLEIVIIGSTHEKRNVDSILSIVDDKQVKSFCGKKNLIETIQLMAESKMILAIDGGMAHLAASLKKDLVTLFGPTNSHNVSPVDTYGLLISNRIECSPCYWSDNYYNCPYDRKCLNEIDQDIIIESVLDVISGKRLENNKINNCYISKIPTYETMKLSL